MSNYQTLVVGTDGSDSSLRAVERAGAIAATHGAKLIVAMAYFHGNDGRGSWGVPPGHTHSPYALRDREGYQLLGDAPIYAILREGRARAAAAGARDIEERPVVGAPINALVDLAAEVDADLLVVGNVGLNSIADRLLGSVPANVSRKAKTDVLIVHTTE
jgi:nucleotide-binding universal stress UspA family protein